MVPTGFRRAPHAVLVGGLLAAGLFAASPALAAAEHLQARGPLVRYSEAVPVGAAAQVDVTYDSAGRTHVHLHVRGLLPDTTYGAHAHAKPCGATGADAGPHFQFQPPADARLASTPAFANPHNEIWLDFRTDAAGNGIATAIQDWQFTGGRRANSVIIHAEGTHTGETDSGVAGPRLACLTVPF